MRGKTLTLSYYARAGADFSPTSNAMPVYLYTGTDVDPNPNTFAGGSWNNTVGIVNATSTLTTSWQRFTHTTAAVSSTANAIILQFNATETGTAGANDYFEITGVQLEISDSATPFQHEDIGTTLRKCKRYYVKDASVIVRNQEGSGQFFQWLEFPVEMRAAPTVTVSNPTYSNANTLYAFNATARGFESGINATAATGYAFFTYEANKEL
jgi:hypothetical protein